MNNISSASCPIPHVNNSLITLAHGGGGKLTSQLIENIFRPAFQNELLNQNHDSAILTIGREKIAMTTDSYVITPLFFPGGDIGSLAVTGTCNDLAMSGARPCYLSAGLILHEGLKKQELEIIINSMQSAAKEINVNIVTGDTKVVAQNKENGLFINTTGIGVIEHNQTIMPSQIQPGDVIILSGDIGCHGTTIMSLRNGLEFESKLKTDCTHLWPMVNELLKNNIEIHCMRDLTRGGLGIALIELAETAKLGFSVDENKIHIVPEVQGACEIFGLDPCYVANEGRFVAFVPKKYAEKSLSLLKKFEDCKYASILGEVSEKNKKRVVFKNKFGTEKFLTWINGEQLPRIC